MLLFLRVRYLCLILSVLCLQISLAGPILFVGAGGDSACNLDIQASTTTPVINSQQFNTLNYSIYDAQNCNVYAWMGSAYIRLPRITISAPITLSCNSSAMYETLHHARAEYVDTVKSIYITARILNFPDRSGSGYVWQAETFSEPFLKYGGCFNITCDSSEQACRLVDPNQSQTLHMIEPTYPPLPAQ